MEEIKQLFHEIINHLHRISVETGARVELIKMKKIDSLGNSGIKKELEKALETLALAEKTAIETGKVVGELKKSIYDALKIDPNKLIKQS